MTLLALFDVDGTLLLSDDPVADEAFVGALRDCYPVDPPLDTAAHITDHFPRRCSGLRARRTCCTMR